MPPIRTHRSRARHFTPPIELSFSEGQIKTPQRCAVLTAKVLSQELGITIPQELVHKVTSVPPRVGIQLPWPDHKALLRTSAKPIF
jgi:hypothetical protein